MSNDQRRSVVTLPETPRSKVDENSPFRDAILNILFRYRPYQLPPGASLTMIVPADHFEDPREHLGFGVIPGMIFPGKSLTDALLVTGFLDWKDLEHSQAHIRYFCGVFPEVAKEELSQDVGEELFLGRQRPIFTAFLGNNNISKQHARIRTKKHGTEYHVEILDGVPERPSAYGSAVLVNPDVAISHTGEVVPLRLYQAPPKASR